MNNQCGLCFGIGRIFHRSDKNGAAADNRQVTQDSIFRRSRGINRERQKELIQSMLFDTQLKQLMNSVYNQKYDYPPEQILSHTFFMRHTKAFYDFYRDKMLCLTAKPNKAHYKLAEMERAGILSSVITQNIDGLHQAAGSKHVMELHGSVHRNYCMKCGKFYDAEYILNSQGVPQCSCGGSVKPDVVLYEEGLDDTTISKSVRAIAEADVLTSELTDLLIEKVYVFPDNRIEIVYKVHDLFE